MTQKAMAAIAAARLPMATMANLMGSTVYCRLRACSFTFEGVQNHPNLMDMIYPLANGATANS